MKKLLILLIFVGLLLGMAPHELCCQEAPTTQNISAFPPIDLLNLPVDISSYFAEKNMDVVKQKQQIVDSLRKSTLSWPSKEKEEGESIIKQIEANLQYHSKILETPPLPPQSTCNPANPCTLNDVIHLYHLTKQSNNALTSLKEALGKINRNITDTEILKGQLRKEYVKSEQTPQKAILGLKILSYWTAQLTSKLEKDQESQLIQSHNEIIKEYEEALDDAVANLTGSPQGLEEIIAKKKLAEDDWKKSQEKVKNHHLSVLRNKIENTVEEKYKMQEILASEIEEVFAHLNVIYYQIKEAIERELIYPKSTNLGDINNHLYEWDKILDVYESNINKWNENTLMQFHRSIEDLSIAEEETPQSQKDNYTKLTKLTQQNQVLLLKLSAEIDDYRFFLSLLESKLTKLEGGPTALGRQLMDTLHDVAETIYSWSSISLFIIGGITITPIDILKFLIIFLGSMWLSRVIFAALTHFSQHRTGVRKSLIYRIHRLIHYALLTLGFFIGLSVIGFDFTSFILVAGALGVGIGFGLQTIVNNFISGIIILFESYLRIGDVIELESGQRGEILEINFRSTTIRTNDGTDLLLPNSLLIDRGVTNWTLADPYRRLHVPFSTSYGIDKEFVAKIISEGAKELSFTIMRPIKPDPLVYLTKLGDNGLEFELIVWVDERVNGLGRYTLSDYLWMIDTILAKHEIEIPSRQMDVRLISKKEVDIT